MSRKWGDDIDTPPLGLRVASGPCRGRGSSRAGRELSRSPESPRGRWQDTRTYEFASAEVSLVYAACAVAVSMVTGVWPFVELHRARVVVRLAAEEPGAGERLTARELSGWAYKLGAREVEREQGT